MLIVSQKRLTVETIEFCGSLYVSSIGDICNDSGNVLGEYETEEKAKNVLQQLWSAYSNGQKVFLMP